MENVGRSRRAIKGEREKEGKDVIWAGVKKRRKNKRTFKDERETTTTTTAVAAAVYLPSTFRFSAQLGRRLRRRGKWKLTSLSIGPPRPRFLPYSSSSPSDCLCVFLMLFSPLCFSFLFRNTFVFLFFIRRLCPIGTNQLVVGANRFFSWTRSLLCPAPRHSLLSSVLRGRFGSHCPRAVATTNNMSVDVPFYPVSTTPRRDSVAEEYSVDSF